MKRKQGQENEVAHRNKEEKDDKSNKVHASQERATIVQMFIRLLGVKQYGVQIELTHLCM